MVVYIVDVLALQLIAIVVDFVLDVEREVGMLQQVNVQTVRILPLISDVHGQLVRNRPVCGKND